MKLRDSRLWALGIAAAFLVLWCVSVGVAHSMPPQEPAVLPEPAATPALHAIGVWGWRLVALGFLGVLAAAMLSGRSRPRRRSAGNAQITRSPRGSVKVVYAPYTGPRGRAGGYRPAVQRRYMK